MSPIFELEAVHFRYPDVPALQGVSLRVEPGECVAVLGANGSGKSTLLRVLAGLSPAEQGAVSFDGRPLAETPEFRRRVGVLFQNTDAQLFNATVLDEVAFGPLQMDWPREKILERVHAVLCELGIEHLKDRPPHRLSGGEKKRVALASVLVLEPDVLLLDEPTATLDPSSQAALLDFLFEGLGRRTVLIATHSLELAHEIAGRCVILDAGRVAADGPCPEILADEALLRRTHLLHAHRHRHPGSVHAHPHRHAS